MRAALLLALAGTSLVFAAGTAMADPACTKEPQSAWMSQEAMKAKIAELGYQKIKTFKVTGSCYEIYGYDKNNKKAEVYFNPVDGSIVKE
ncbi:PepSY domain-containing protein [Kaistia algarum]|uniref:PepSY domain-containing protein n=1 Tax=Kaistia algarum TaxID=2083279 RepID=UPI000CE76CFD|nr:PepSY domain-containing protein [Kaistia algarum]MCX5513110.1 PepSY domain-containing protein [Kaistia algarum]PPE81416.1 PepSY domain-containing protein [Kaistia algarum]